MSQKHRPFIDCEEARRQFELYADSEGIPESFRAVNDHLSECMSCSDWYQRQLGFESQLSSMLREGSPTAEIWENIGATLQQTARSRVRNRRWIAVVAACALIGLVTWTFTTGLIHDQNHLVQLALGEHDRIVSGQEPCQILSESDLEVEAYLKQRVSFPVRCPPRQDAGFHVRGGGVCSLGKSPAAFVHGVVGGSKASIFILHRADASNSAAEIKSKVYRVRKGRIGLVLGIIDENLVIVVGDDSVVDLEKVLSAYGTYPDHKTST